MVTGSCMLLQHAGRRVLVDCGMFQGGKTVKQLNYQPLPVRPVQARRGAAEPCCGRAIPARGPPELCCRRRPAQRRGLAMGSQLALTLLDGSESDAACLELALAVAAGSAPISRPIIPGSIRCSPHR
jgi:hypothetical protein